MATVAVLGTMDTKGEEHAFVADLIRARGHRVLVIDVGILEAPRLRPDLSREMVAEKAGIDLPALVRRGDRGEAVAAMAKAAPVLLGELAAEGRIDGVIS